MRPAPADALIMSSLVHPNLPPTALMIDTKKPPMGPMLVSPNARINGYVVPLQWGQNVIPAHPGVHHVEVYIPWLWDQGKAHISVDNTHQPAPPIYYAMPFTNFSKGAIDFAPVKNPGVVGMVLLLAVVALFAIVPLMLALLT